MPSVRDLDDLGDAFVLALTLVGSVGDRPGNGVVLLAGYDEQRAPLGVLGVDLRFRPWVQVGRRRLEDRDAGTRDGEVLVELLGFLFGNSVGECVMELLI